MRERGEVWKDPISCSMIFLGSGPKYRPKFCSSCTISRNLSTFSYNELELGGVNVREISGIPIKKPDSMPSGML